MVNARTQDIFNIVHMDTMLVEVMHNIGRKGAKGVVSRKYAFLFCQKYKFYDYIISCHFMGDGVLFHGEGVCYFMGDVGCNFMGDVGCYSWEMG